MTTAFQPKRADGRALWRVAFDFVVESMEHGRFRDGDVISHQDMAEAMGMEAQSASYYQSVNKAIVELQREHGRTLITRKGEGYQIARGMEHLGKGAREEESSRRKLTKAIATVETVSENGLTPGQVTTVRQLQNGMRFMAQVMAATRSDQEQMARDLDMLKADRIENRSRQHATNEQMRRMQERLEKLESERDPYAQ